MGLSEKPLPVGETDTETVESEKKPQRPEKTAEKTVPPIPPRKTSPALSPAAAAAALQEARSDLERGRFERSIAAAAEIGTDEAHLLERQARLLRQMVSDVDVDPGAGRKTIIAVTLANGNVLHAVEAKLSAGTWDLRLADGIKCGLPEDKVRSVEDQNATAFHEERLTTLRQRVRHLVQGGVFECWKAIRLAWRRGFPTEAYRVYEELTGTPKALEALSVVVPGAEELVVAAAPEPPEIAEASPPPGETTSPDEPSPGQTIEPTRPPADPKDEAAFAEVDSLVRQAQGKIHAALNEEGAAADALIQEAGKLLVAARQELTSNSSLPRGEAYQARMHKVTLILDDFLKMSSFGINRGRR